MLDQVRGDADQVSPVQLPQLGSDLSGELLTRPVDPAASATWATISSREADSDAGSRTRAAMGLTRR